MDIRGKKRSVGTSREEGWEEKKYLFPEGTSPRVIIDSNRRDQTDLHRATPKEKKCWNESRGRLGRNKCR